jgi:predicted nucleic acid-binding protein
MTLVDSSVWVEYFRHGRDADLLHALIDEALMATNELILAELLPPLAVRKQSRLISLLKDIPRLPLRIDWDGVVDFQITCLRNGIQRVGVPDLIIAQNAIQHGAAILSRDKHFHLMARHLPLAVA